ncbi:hypothetical protein B9Z55_008181 [Caenorhabditis nigoni]|uniref:Uncharacterized protein n=1 Tax=Caenorhabditis nigoni TaxID=1611254 RepID=A0A2G5VD00_9PELO|nr:hypothetical protein B9Z55_008181 [Caenorhabditis nigoni]
MSTQYSNFRRLLILITGRNSLNTDGYYRDLEKMHEHGLFTTGVNYNAEKSEDFLNLIERMQSNRLDDQRCDLPERVRGFSES